MEFGLWVEPEMVNLDSELARNPDWILRGRDDLPLPARQQYVLDLANPDAWQYLLERLDALLAEYDIAYLKWDHNRDLLEAGAADSGRPRGARERARPLPAARRAQARHPGLEIESCASGGARVDLGILEHTDRIWTSDTSTRSSGCRSEVHRTRRAARDDRCAPDQSEGALHPPEVGLDLSAASPCSATSASSGTSPRWTTPASTECGGGSAHKRHRELIHTGTLVHADTGDAATDVRGVVARDATSALFTFTQVTTGVTHPPGRFTLPAWLDRRYTVRIIAGRRRGPGQSDSLGRAADHADRPATGTVGLQAPVLLPRAARTPAPARAGRDGRNETTHRSRYAASPATRPPQNHHRSARRRMMRTTPPARTRTRRRPRRQAPLAAASVAVVAVASLMLAGCSANGGDDGRVQLDFFQFKGEALEDFEQIIADFEAENPDIDVVQNQVADADTRSARCS